MRKNLSRALKREFATILRRIAPEFECVCASEAGTTRVQVPPLDLDCSRAHRGGRTVGRETQV